MNVLRRTPQMTREAFFDWAHVQRERYECDGFAPVMMTGGKPLGPDAGIASAGDAWTATALSAGEKRRLPERGIEIPMADFDEGTDIPEDPQAS